MHVKDLKLRHGAAACTSRQFSDYVWIAYIYPTYLHSIGFRGKTVEIMVEWAAQRLRK